MSTYRRYFLRTCVLNPWFDNEDEREKYLNTIDEILDSSDNTDEFIEKFLEHDEFKMMQGYQEVIKRERPNRIWKFIRENFGDKCFKTESDAGGVLVYCDDMEIIIPNGRGDGTTRIAVFENGEEFYSSILMKYFSGIRGKFSISYYDCRKNPAIELDGDYSAYYFDGLVVFVKY